ncbi:MAG TPA: hypothetical protein VJR89_21295 [Polyangiales bacterium]|nr:hypothetical protein [Polyangiales bacterium]
MRRAQLSAVCLVWSCAACYSASGDPTETLVVIEADEQVASLTRQISARVTSEDGTVRYEKTDIGKHFPMRLAIVPRGGVATRTARVSIDALGADGARVVGAQAIIGFVANQKRYHHIWLSGACLHAPECGADMTCLGGECVSARVPPERLETLDCSLSGCKPPAARGEAGAPATQPIKCREGWTLCGGKCVNVLDDQLNCGTCGHDCSNLNNVRAEARCVEGRCAFDADGCNPGHGDCDADPDTGCEQELSMQEHCGQCGVDCTGKGEICVAGRGGVHSCVGACPAEKPTACNGMCVDLSTAREHCGECGHACAPGLSCVDGACKPICAKGELSCDDKCVDPTHDAQNCGTCGARCGSDRACSAGKCIDCPQGLACKASMCTEGVTQCEPDPTCKNPAPVPDGKACGDGATCQGGRCSCGLSTGSVAQLYGCDAQNKCKPGDACVDLAGNGAFFCKPLCDTDADCRQVRDWDWHCSAALCSNGRNTGIRVCNEQDSYLEPMYNSTACCRGPDAANVSASGCADDTREAFQDLGKFPDIAGCEAKWPKGSMRAARSGVACGNTLGVECEVPADACGTG